MSKKIFRCMMPLAGLGIRRATSISKGVASPSAIGALLLLCSASVNASFVFAPLSDLGLNPGDEYRYLFVTSTTRDGTSSNIADYNAFVQSVADGSGSLFAGSGITWYAIASTASTSAAANMGGGFASPIFQPDGRIVATDDSDLWDGSISSPLLSPLEVSEQGLILDTRVWTGSNSDGTSATTRYLGGTTTSNYGATGTRFSSWVVFGNGSQTNLYSLYAISEELTVPAAAAPISSSVSLLGLGLLAAVLTRGRYRFRLARS